MPELFTTIVAILVISHKIMSYFYIKMGRKYTKLVYTEFYFFTDLFKRQKIPTKYFFLSLLWITVYICYNYEYIKTYVLEVLKCFG